MRKISLLILCILFASKTNSIHAQTILTSEVTNQENQIVTEQDSIYEQSPINNTQDTINPQNNTAQKTNLSERIKQQAKATREKVITQINRNNTLSTIRSRKLQTENTNKTMPVNQVSEGVVTSQPETISEESTISTIGQKYRVAFNKLTDIQVKIENAINEIENSTKININTARENLQKSKESLVNSDNSIQRLEQISIHTELNSEIKASMSEAKKGLLNSKQYLSSILISLKQATRAKPIIQTGGGTTGSGGTSGSSGENGGQTDGNNTGDTETGDQPRR